MMIFNIDEKEIKIPQYEDDHKYHYIFTDFYKNYLDLLSKANENRKKRIVFDEDGYEIGRYGCLFS